MSEIPFEQQVGEFLGVEKPLVSCSGDVSDVLQQTLEEFRTEKAFVRQQLELQDQRHEEQHSINSTIMSLL